MKALLRYSLYTITLVLIITIALPHTSFAQLRVYEDIGGNPNDDIGTTTNDNSFIYIVGGAVIAGIVLYALVFKKDNTPKPDTTAVIDSELKLNAVTIPSSTESEIVKAKEKLPFDFFFGIRNSEAVLRDKTYLVGVSVRL